jgi:hypothetical protein
MNTATVSSVLATLPWHVVYAFSAALMTDHVRLEHADSTSPSQRREEMYDARVALERAGFRVADSYATLLVFPPLPEPERCDVCHAPNVSACRCRDLVTE